LGDHAEWFRKHGVEWGQVPEIICSVCRSANRDSQTPDSGDPASDRRTVSEATGIGPQRAAPSSVAKIQAQTRQSAADLEAAGDTLEAAWAEWSRSVRQVDERAMTLLRAAFEAGWEAGRR
jgi:hypothetical protein